MNDRVKQLLDAVQERLSSSSGYSQDIYQQGWQGASPQARDYMMGMGQSMVGATASPQPLMDENTMNLVQSILRRMRGNRNVSLQDYSRLRDAYEVNIPPMTGEGMKTGRLPGMKDMANILSGLIPKQRFDIKQIIPK